MADFTSAPKFIALQWKRGTGYYGAKEDRRPRPWRDFRRDLGPVLPLDIIKGRYLCYLLSWSLHHDALPEPEELDERPGVGTKIMVKLEEMLYKEESLRQYMADAPKPKKRGRKKR